VAELEVYSQTDEQADLSALAVEVAQAVAPLALARRAVPSPCRSACDRHGNHDALLRRCETWWRMPSIIRAEGNRRNCRRARPAAPQHPATTAPVSRPPTAKCCFSGFWRPTGEQPGCRAGPRHRPAHRHGPLAQAYRGGCEGPRGLVYPRVLGGLGFSRRCRRRSGRQLICRQLAISLGSQSPRHRKQTFRSDDDAQDIAGSDPFRS